MEVSTDITNVAISEPNQDSSLLRLCYLDWTNEQRARKMLQTLGQTLGPKYGATLVDAMVSDVLEACLDRLFRNGNRISSVEEMRPWMGSLAAAKEVSKWPVSGVVNRAMPNELPLTNLADSLWCFLAY